MSPSFSKKSADEVVPTEWKLPADGEDDELGTPPVVAAHAHGKRVVKITVGFKNMSNCFALHLYPGNYSLWRKTPRLCDFVCFGYEGTGGPQVQMSMVRGNGRDRELLQLLDR